MQGRREFVQRRRKPRQEHSPHEEDDDSVDDEMKQKELLKKQRDDKLLLDLCAEAGIPVEGMGEEEKKQILEALRESLPEPEDPVPSTSKEQKLPEDNEQDIDEEEEEELPKDSLQTLPFASVDSDDEPDKEVPHDPVQTLPVKSVGCDNELVHDSKTPTVPTAFKKTRNMLKKQLSAEITTKTDATKIRNTRSQQRKIVDDHSDTNFCGSVSDTSENGNRVQVDICTSPQKKLSVEQMKLSPRQKRRGQRRFKDLFDRMNLSFSQQSGSSRSSDSTLGKEEKGKKRKRTKIPSQDLFLEDPSDEETHSDATIPEPIQVKSSSSESEDTVVPKEEIPDNAAASDNERGNDRLSSGLHNQTQTFGSPPRKVNRFEVEMDDEETLPPEDLEPEKDEEEKSETDQTERLENRKTSTVRPIQASWTASSLPQSQHSDSSRSSGKTSPSIPMDGENGGQHLLCDNRFSWPSVPPGCCLQRKYKKSSQKRKTLPSSENLPYFCPEGENPAAYSKVIIQMFDSYFLRFSQMQPRVQMLLPWGKPIRTGQHLPETLDMKKKGEPSIRFDWDDEEDFKSGQSRCEKVSNEVSGPKEKRIKSVRDIDFSAKIKKQTFVADGQGSLFLTQRNASDLTVDTAAYEAETQPFDTDDELPDIDIDRKDTVNTLAKSQEKRNALSGPSPVYGGSQSSNSLLNENGDLYSTQIPHRKRQAGVQNRGSACDAGYKRTRREGLRNAVGILQKDNDKTNVRSLSRKRKQVSPSNMDDLLCTFNDDDDDDDEVSFPRKRKVNIRASNPGYSHISASSSNIRENDHGYIHISASSRTNRKIVKSAVVHPIPRRTDPLGSNMGFSCHAGMLSDAGDNKFQPIKPDISPSFDVKEAQSDTDVEESDDSVHLDEPSSCSKAFQRKRITGSQQSELTEETAADGHDVAAAAEIQAPSPVAHDAGEEMLACPLCNKEFPVAVIERHASDCNGEEDTTITNERETPHGIVVSDSVSTANQLKRRPLRAELIREKFVCPLCNMDVGGSGALKRHFEKCRLQFETDAAASTSAEAFVFDIDKGQKTYSRSSRLKWTNAHKTSKTEDGAKERMNTEKPSTSAEVDEIQEDSDDSGKHSDFIPPKDVEIQRRGEIGEDSSDEENISAVSKFPSTSNVMKNSTKLKNKQQKRQSKLRER